MLASMTDTSMRSRSSAVLMALLMLASVGAAEPAASGDALVTDQWFVGDLNGQPAMTMHTVVTRHAGGTQSDVMDSKVVINRSLGGASIRFEVGDAQRFDEDAHGLVTGFRFDHVENDQPVSAVGRVEDGKVLSTVHHLGRATDTTLAIPAGVALLGQQASQDLLAKRAWKAGDKEEFASLAFISNQVQIVRMTATYTGATAKGDLQFTVVMDLMPVPTAMTLTPKGDLVAMSMSMGFITMAFRPSPGPVALEGAELAPTGLVTAAGPAPSAGPVNRYRLPAGAGAAVDEFQRQDGQVVTVTSRPPPSPLDDPKPFLRAEAQLELDDPALRAWVRSVADKHQGDQAELAEHLRLAVRSYIVHKDLSMGDASALEAFRTQRGDCTEHANLLCAALRIAGIPARVECGLVFADAFGGWVGHAWNSAYVGGRWVHLDSAYPGVERSCYLKLGTTSGGAGEATGAAMLKNLATVMGKQVETLAP
jgi:hypothetical protein